MRSPNRRSFRGSALLVTAFVVGSLGSGGVADRAEASPRADLIAAAGPAAQQGQRECRVSASVTVAQAILESAWEESDLARSAQNYFGIKADRR
jgi:flagellum-specific peptidoglycan hydrolase FlgJ